MGLVKDGPLNSVGDIIPNVGSPMQVPSPVMPRGDADLMLIKKIAQLQHHHQQSQQLQQPQQQLQQHSLSSQHSQNSNHHLHQQHKVGGGSITADGSMSNSVRGNDQAVLWNTDPLKSKTTLEEHSMLITDVRFSPSMPRLATSSFDKTFRVWDADNPGYSLRTFTGHSAPVLSLDFHPNKDDLICSCDGDSEIRYWSINNGSCARVLKGGTSQMRFQPRLGRYLAAAAENVVSILDVETHICRHSLQGHTKPVHSVCWDPSGELVAYVSEDSLRVWTFGSGNEGECVHELSCNGNKFHSCVFHPSYPSLLVIGCYQSLELWDVPQNKTMTLAAQEGLIASLAVSNVTFFVASASHDNFVKL